MINYIMNASRIFKKQTFYKLDEIKSQKLFNSVFTR